MKKILLTLAAAMGMAASANAQLAEGSVFPDFTLTDVNGNAHHLYDYLDAGKTVIIDISATWCPPCWAYHNTHALDSMWSKHGPAGQPGVNATTTDDMVVLFFQGEPTSHLAELYGDVSNGAIIYTTTEDPKSNVTQGNWVANTSYPIIDDTSSTDPAYKTSNIDALWNIQYFPTIYMICRDHLVHELTQPTEAQAYAARNAVCPAYAPSGTVDAKVVAYLDKPYFICNATPTLRVQNYSTSALSSATVTVKDGTGATVATQTYSTPIAALDVANISIPAFANAAMGGYKYTVTATGDGHTENNASADSLFKLYDAANATSIPFYDDLTGAISYRYNFPTDGSIGLPNPSWPGCPNPAGVTANKYLLVDFYDFYPSTGDFNFVIGNFNTAGDTGIKFEFDEAYALEPYGTGTMPSDKLTLQVSANCGASWSTIWTGVNSTLITNTTPVDGFVPGSTDDWAHRTVKIPVADSNDNMMLKFVGTSSFGNYAWLTNMKLSGTHVGPTSVQKVLGNNEVVIAPNPAKDMANISLMLTEGADVQVVVYDAVGRAVNTISRNLAAGAQSIELPTQNLAAGLYTVKIVAGTNVVTKQLSVMK